MGQESKRQIGNAHANSLKVLRVGGPRGKHADTCPLQALLSWQAVARRKAGPLFRRVELAALRRYDELGGLDEDSGWDAEYWRDAMERYYAEYAVLGAGADARGPHLLVIDEARGTWKVRQIFDDPEGDHDWGIAAEVDLAASDEAGEAVVRLVDVGPH